jgi:hypothetical protein
MHEMRSLMQNGGHRELVVKKGDGPTPRKAAGLAGIPILREEARRTDQRREDRHMNLVDGAVITFRRKRIEVEVINISSHGVMIDSDIEPRLGERVEIRFEDCNRTMCTVRWIKGRQIGLEFAAETVLIAPPDVRDYIVSGRRAGEKPPKLEIKPDRAPRQSLIWKGILHFGIESLPVRLRNISQEGAMLDCAEDVLAGTPVVLELDGAGANAVQAKVRWCRSGQIGVHFDEPFDMRILAGVAPSREPVATAARYVKPDYLGSEGDDESPWAARTYGLRPSDL